METEAHPAGAERAREALNAPSLRFDLDDEVRRLWGERASRLGRNAKTLVKHRDFRIVLAVLKAGRRIQEHEASGRISIQTVRGRIRMHVLRMPNPELIDVPAGHLLALDRSIRHDVEALEDSAFLLTVAWPEDRRAETDSAASGAAPTPSAARSRAHRTARSTASLPC